MKLDKNIKAIKSYGARVIAISVDKNDIAETKKKGGRNFEVMADPNLEMVKAWRVPTRGGISTWASFVVDSKGQIRYAKLGYSDDLSKDVLRVLKSI